MSQENLINVASQNLTLNFSLNSDSWNWWKLRKMLLLVSSKGSSVTVTVKMLLIDFESNQWSLGYHILKYCKIDKLNWEADIELNSILIASNFSSICCVSKEKIVRKVLHPRA